MDAPVWRPRGDDLRSEGVEHAPTGSQRALTALRGQLDEIAAQRRNYVRLAAVPPALGAPESAVVAAFERVDVADSDPMAEIIAGRVAPDRALADHAFAHALLARAGVIVAISAGPLIVAPDLARGVPSDAATRAGRALALQALSVAIARGNGVPDEQLLVGAVPGWLIDEPKPAARAAAEVAIRRALYPTLGLSFEEPPQSRGSTGEWAAIVAAVSPSVGAAVILRRPGEDAGRAVTASRLGANVGRELADSIDPPVLRGPALEHARATVAAATTTLERLADDGWRAVLGDSLQGPERVRLGEDSVAERTESFDPLARALAAVG
jgi:hypothetical protein